MLREIQIPVLGMMQVRDTALHQRANEIQRQSRAFVRPQQELRIGFPFNIGETCPVDQISSITRQRGRLSRLELLGARLGILSGEATDADHGLVASLNQRQAHL